MSKVAIIHSFGGPEVLSIEDVEIAAPGAGQILLRQEAAAIHFADTLVREGMYFLKPDLPAILGLEGAGIVEAVGPGVDNVGEGDRVAYRFNLGGYAERRLIAADQLYKLPEGVDAKTAAAIMVRGLTAQYLLRQLYPVSAGETVLIHTAAGGMGSLLTQWAKHLGATVIGTVGAPEKIAIARTRGCDHVINYNEEDFADRVLEITGGEGVPVLYDAVGKDAYDGNVRCLAPRGWFVNYGHASGFLPPIDAMEINKKSLIFTKASLKDYNRTPEDSERMSAEVFEMIAAGVLMPNISREYALDEIAQAHIDIAGRKTTGTIILTF